MYIAFSHSLSFSVEYSKIPELEKAISADCLSDCAELEIARMS